MCPVIPIAFSTTFLLSPMSLNTSFSCVLSLRCTVLVIKYHLAKKPMRMERLLCSSFVLRYSLCLPVFSHIIAVLPSCRRRQQIWITNAFFQNLPVYKNAGATDTCGHLMVWSEGCGSGGPGHRVFTRFDFQ